MTAQGATSGSPFFDDYRVEASTGNAASPSTVFLQLGNWISAPLFPHFWQRAFLRKTSVDASGPKRMTALQEPDGVSLLQEVRQFGDVRGDSPRFIARQPVHEAATHGLVFEIHVSQRPAVCIFDNEAFAVLNKRQGAGSRRGSAGSVTSPPYLGRVYSDRRLFSGASDIARLMRVVSLREI